MHFSITTLGCKVNQYDGCLLRAALVEAGLEPLEGPAPADLAVINTCCVTAAAMQKSRAAIRRALRRSPGATVLVTGCYGDYDAGAIRRVLAQSGVPAGKAFLAGHHDDLSETIRQVRQSMGQSGGTSMPHPGGLAERSRNEICMNAGHLGCQTTTPLLGDIRARRLAAVKRNIVQTPAPRISSFPDHRRAFVKVQDGCDTFCSYCVVPYTRCRLWSSPPEQVERQCRDFLAGGHREIVLSGIFLGAYGRDTAIRRRWGQAPSLLPDLVRRVAGIEGLWRVRLSSLEPLDLTPELLAVCRGEKVAPHFHLPLQSGSAKVLARMNRQYAPQQYRRTVDRLREAIDRVAITTDIIVGFPGEDDEDFRQTLDLARFAGFSRIHAFPFSAIEGTAAWNWRKQAPPPAVVKARLAELAEVQEQLSRQFRRQFLGETMEGIVERTSRSRIGATTDRHITITAHRPTAGDDLRGQVVRVRAESLSEDGLEGRLLQPSERV